MRSRLKGDHLGTKSQNLLPRNIDIQRRHEEGGGRGRDQIQEPSFHVELSLNQERHFTHAWYRAMQCFNAISSSPLSKKPGRLQPRSYILSVNVHCRCTYPQNE